MAAYRYSARYRTWYRPSRSRVPMPVVIGAILALAASGTAKATHTHVPVINPGPAAAPAAGYAALGQKMAAQAGWTGPEWNCLDSLWTRESGWQMVWNTQGSGAYGIPQALPASKMASAGADYMTNPATQIRWGLGYVANTPYGTHTPCQAWSHETQDGWY